MLISALACPLQAQTYKLGSDGSQKPQTNKAHGPSPAPSLGWGSNIQNARLAGAAELALKHGDRALAVDYAQRAAQAAPNDSQLWFLLGYAARLDGKYQASADAYSRGLRLNPSALEGISGLAQTYSAMGRTEDAERLLKQVISSDAKRIDDALLLGELLMKGGDYTTALEGLRRAEQIQPGARSELLIALCYQHLKQFELASRYLDLAKKRAPDNIDVERSLAGYYREVGNYPEAIASLKSIRNPKPDVKAELAYAYQLDGKQADAAKLYAQAANALPRDLDLQLSAAQADVAAGSIEYAGPFLQRATRLDPGNYRLHAIRGEIARLQERDNDAVSEYNAALASLPSSAPEGPLYGIQLHMDLMEVYANLKNPIAARKQLETARKQIDALDDQGPGRAQFMRLRALIEMNSGDLDRAERDIKEALAIDAHDPSSLQIDGDVLGKRGRTEEAIAAYKRILAIDSVNRFALTSLGLCLAHGGG